MSEIDNPLVELGLDDLRRRTSAKWRTYDPQVLPLWVAEMDVRLAGPVHAAVAEVLDSGDTGYPSDHSFRAYAEALAAFAADRWGWTGLDPARTAVVADVMTGVVEALDLVTAPGSSVVVNSPVYPPFFGFVEHSGREVVEAPLGADGRLDPATLEEAFTGVAGRERPAAYLLCSPQNPTGVVHTAEELTTVAALAREHGVRVVVDEIHAPLVLPGAGFVPFLSVPGAERAFSLMSASKAWNLAGIKAAVLSAGPEAAEDLARLPEVVGHGPSHLGVVAHTAALAEGGAWLDALLRGLEVNRGLLGDLLAKHLPDVSWVPPQGTYLSWLDCRELGLGPDPAAVFLERAQVAVMDGSPFGSGGAGRVRLNYATSPDLLTAAVERMGTAVT